MRTAVSFELELACCSSWSRAAQELLAGHAGAILKLHREAARLAEAADGAGHERKDLRVAEVAEGARCASDDGVGGVFLARTVVPRGKVEEALAGILADCTAASAAAGDGEKRLDVLRFMLVEIILDFALDLERPALRRARRANGPEGSPRPGPR